MHTYRKSKNEQLWTVGYWRREGQGGHVWEPLSDHSSEWDAMCRVNFLNGGEMIIPSNIDELTR